MTAFVKERTARAERNCEWCTDPIRPGTRYQMHIVSLDEENGNSADRWVEIPTHVRNAQYECEPDRTEPTGADQ